MAGCESPSVEEICWTIAAARLIFGPAMNIQAPPNLAPGQNAFRPRLEKKISMFHCCQGAVKFARCPKWACSKTCLLPSMFSTPLQQTCCCSGDGTKTLQVPGNVHNTTTWCKCP